MIFGDRPCNLAAFHFGGFECLFRVDFSRKSSA